MTQLFAYTVPQQYIQWVHSVADRSGYNNFELPETSYCKAQNFVLFIDYRMDGSRFILPVVLESQTWSELS